MSARTEVMGIEVLAFARLLLAFAATFTATWEPGAGPGVAGEAAPDIRRPPPADAGDARRLEDEGDGWRGRAQPGYRRAVEALSLSARLAERLGDRAAA